MDDLWLSSYSHHIGQCGSEPITGADAESVWDGEGEDPWLSSRMAAAAEAAAAEAAIREELWAEMSGWLVSVSRAVLGAGPVPDPAAVYSQQPEWVAVVNRVVNGPVRDAIGDSYRVLLGDGYRFDQRPAVVEHLANVSNRMVRTVDSVFDLVSQQVAVGATRGESAYDISRRVEGVLSATDTERWPNRATVVARTETMGALNAGRQDSFVAVAEELGEPFEQTWVSTLDRRTRPTHRRADGQRVPVGQPFLVGGASLRYPGDPAGPGRETIQCRCTMILLEPGENVDMTYRQFRSH